MDRGEVEEVFFYEHALPSIRTLAFHTHMCKCPRPPGDPCLQGGEQFVMKKADMEKRLRMAREGHRRSE